jgi:hypothetical protein
MISSSVTASACPLCGSIATAPSSHRAVAARICELASTGGQSRPAGPADASGAGQDAAELVVRGDAQLGQALPKWYRTLRGLRNSREVISGSDRPPAGSPDGGATPDPGLPARRPGARRHQRLGRGRGRAVRAHRHEDRPRPAAHPRRDRHALRGTGCIRPAQLPQLRASVRGPMLPIFWHLLNRI